VLKARGIDWENIPSPYAHLWVKDPIENLKKLKGKIRKKKKMAKRGLIEWRRKGEGPIAQISVLRDIRSSPIPKRRRFA